MTDLSCYLDCLERINTDYCKPSTGGNLKLIINCPEYETDPDTGELVVDPLTGGLAMTNKTDTILARVSQTKNPQAEIEAGTDRSRVYVTGYLVEPKTLQYLLDEELDAEFLFNGKWIKAKFYYDLTIQDNFAEQSKLYLSTGSKIAGYLKLEMVS